MATGEVKEVKTPPNAPENVTAESTAPEIVTAQLMYCLACKSHTENKDLRTETFTTNGKERKIEKAICQKCNKKKNKFVKSS